MKNKLEFLKNVYLFKGINEKYIADLIKDFTFHEYEINNQIIKEGEKGSEIFFLFKGEVEVSKRMTLMDEIAGISHVDKSLTTLNHSNYAFFGEMSLCGENEIRSATVTSKTNCTIGIIDAENLLYLLNKYDDFGHKFFKNLSNVLADRLRNANKNILKLTTALTLALDE